MIKNIMVSILPRYYNFSVNNYYFSLGNLQQNKLIIIVLTEQIFIHHLKLDIIKGRKPQFIYLQAFQSQIIMEAMQTQIRIGKYASEFRRNDLIGKDVYVGHQILRPDNKVAIKLINIQEYKKSKRKAEYKTLKDRVIQQIRLMFNYQSEGVVKILGFNQIQIGIKKQQHYAIVMQKMDGNLKDMIYQNKKLSVNESLKIIWKITQCYEDLYNSKVVHRNLKPENILYRKVGSYVAFKISDFGFDRSPYLNPITNKGITSQSYGYSSPELRKGERVSAKADLYSLGVIFVEMLTGSDDILDYTVFVNDLESYENSKKQIKNILKKSEIQQPIIKFIENCLIYDEQKRMSWEQAYENNIFEAFFQKDQHIEKQAIKIVKKSKKIAITPDAISPGLRQQQWKIGNTNSNVCIKYNNYSNYWLCSSALPFDSELVFTIKVIQLTGTIYMGVMDNDKKGEIMADTDNYTVYLSPYSQKIFRPNERQTKHQYIKCQCSSLPKCPFQIQCHVNRQQNTITWHYRGKQQAKSTMPKAWKTNKKQLCAIVLVYQKGDSVEMM